MSTIGEEYLKFIRDNFNLDSDRTLDDITETARGRLSSIYNSKVNRKDSLKAKELSSELGAIKITTTKDINNYVRDITSELLDVLPTNIGQARIFNITNDFINDLQETVDWLDKYREFMLNTSGIINIEALGKAILLRAVELAPIDTGLLRKSGLLVTTNNSIEIIFSVPYAVYVHEDMDARHTTGRSKFLEVAVQEVFKDETIVIDILDNGAISWEYRF